MEACYDFRFVLFWTPLSGFIAKNRYKTFEIIGILLFLLSKRL